MNILGWLDCFPGSFGVKKWKKSGPNCSNSPTDNSESLTSVLESLYVLHRICLKSTHQVPFSDYKIIGQKCMNRWFLICKMTKFEAL